MILAHARGRPSTWWGTLAEQLGALCSVAADRAQHAEQQQRRRLASAAVAEAAAPQPQRQQQQQQQQHRRRVVPDDGRSLADFLAGSGAGAAADQGGSPPSNQIAQQRGVLIETYGCQMNVNDSEIVASVLAAQQYTRAASAEQAGVVLLNTCAIREHAEARIWGRLGELQALKKKRRANKQPPLVVGVLGCMAERLKDKLLDEQRLADLVVGPDAYRDLPRIISAVQEGEARGAAAMNTQLSLEETYADIAPVRSDPSSRSAFVSIMRGCSNMCSFCIVPFTRGRERSRPASSVLREVEALAAAGVREVTLLGQNVNSYADLSHLPAGRARRDGGGGGGAGTGAAGPGGVAARVYAPGFSSVYTPRREGAVGFAELLRRVAGVDPEMRVRFTSPHPKEFNDEVLQVIASLPNVSNYLHMPAQSGSSGVLERMRRGYTREAYDALTARARATVPNVALSTDIIAGFCGETEEEHRETVDLLASTRFDNAFLFSYSRREKTHAARHLDDDVPPETKARRLAELFDAYREGQARLNAAEVGRLHLALLDGRPRRGGDAALQGRTDSWKRVIVPEQQLPPSLAELRRNCERGAGGGAAAGAAPPPYEGPLVRVGAGDYVAVMVRRVAGRGTLLSAPLARTSVAEFAALLGSCTPAAGATPAWLAEHAAAQPAPEPL